MNAPGRVYGIFLPGGHPPSPPPSGQILLPAVYLGRLPSGVSGWSDPPSPEGQAMTERVSRILQSIEAVLDGSPTTRELRDLVGGLGGCQVEAQARFLTLMARPQRDEDSPVLLDVDQAAALMNVTRRWVYRNEQRLQDCIVRPSPHVLRFDKAKLLKWIERHHER